MKKVRILAVLAITGILLACASTEVTGELGLDAAIQMASRDISGALPAGTKVALLNFSSPSDVFSSYVLEEMSIYLVRDRNLIVVDRREIDLIRSEMDFQMSGEVSDASAQSIGRMLGAQSIISGSWLTIGDSHRFRTRVINVNTAAIETSKSITVNDSPTIQHLLAQGYNRPAAPQMAAVAPAPTAVAPPALAEPATAPAIPAYVPAAPVAPAAPALREFRIGDIGPAGGIIFFDQGSNAGGWRFLEAAPMEAEFQASWSVRNTAVRDTRPEIGSGRRNTQLILETFRQTAGEWDTAAQMADDLVINGFDDWFLPSRDELDQMFGNLRRRNLGDFRNDWYWSSSGWWPNRQNFNNGQISGDVGPATRLFVRPIRQVPGPPPTRASLDEMPSAAAGIAATGGGAGTASAQRTNRALTWAGRILGVALVGGLVAWAVISNPGDDAAMAMR